MALIWNSLQPPRENSLRACNEFQIAALHLFLSNFNCSIALLLQTLYVLVAVLAVASCLADKENRRRPGLRGKARAGARKVARHEDKANTSDYCHHFYLITIIMMVQGERVWHLAQSAEECGTFAHGDLHQRDSRPHQLCTEVGP